MHSNSILMIVYILLVIIFFSLNYYEKFTQEQLNDTALNYREIISDPSYTFPKLTYR